jgi:hypothetical protein
VKVWSSDKLFILPQECLEFNSPCTNLYILLVWEPNLSGQPYNHPSVNLTKGPRSKVQWNWAFLLVQSFKLVPMPLDEGSRSKQIKLWFSLHGIILEGKSNCLDQKRELNREFMVWKPKCKLGSIFFLFFSLFSFTLVQILWEWKTCYELSTLLEHTSSPILDQFWSWHR